MHLYFLRHGRAANPGDWPGDDDSRPLTEQGRDELRKVAQGLRRLDLSLDAILTSPLVRARETAQIVASELGLSAVETPLLEPGCDLGQLALLAKDHETAHDLMVVGHEPDFSAMIGRLAGRHGHARVEMRKAACCRVDLPAPIPAPDAIAATGTLVWLLHAKHLARIGR